MRTYGATALLLLLMSACGDGSDPTGQPPIQDPIGPPTPPSEVQGHALYAIDDENHLYVFGTENPGTIALAVPIRGLPFLRSMVGIDFRPSTGVLYGVGNDGRVYVIDGDTGEATAVASEPFTSDIGSFDHFGMAFEGNPERIRLISGGGRNWSIDPDDGTAVRESDARYAAGDAHEGETLRISGLSMAPAGTVSGSLAAGMQQVAGSAANPVEALIYDSFNGMLAGAVDPATGEFQSLGPIDGISNTQCAAVTFDPGGFMLALAPIAAALGPEVAGAYGLFRMAPGGLATLAGELGAPAAQAALQSVAFFDAVTGGD